MRKIIFIILLLISSIYAKKLLLVTLEAPPAEYLENNKATGANVDIVTEALTRLGYSVEIKFYPWKRALRMVEFGQADGIIDASYNENRAKYMFFPKEAISTEKWYGFKRKGSLLTLDEDFENAKYMKLGVARAFIYGGEIQKAINSGKFKYLDVGHNNLSNIKKLIANRFDMFIGVKATILLHAKKTGDFDKIEIIKKTGTNEDYLLNSSRTYLGFSKKRVNKKLAEDFSKSIAQMKADGTIENIRKKYYINF
jgi:polar amino acid transport system substrate-binding protein